MTPSFLRMESTSLLCLLLVQFISVFARIKYNTNPPILSSIQTVFYPRANTKVKTCFLKPDEGPCRANLRMWYFDPGLNNCSTFRWGGCQGNGNRFESSGECRRSCIIPSDYKPSRPRYCQLSFDYGFCFGTVNKWYYDRHWKVCKKTIYSGCGGNKNNFNTFEQCDTICRLGNASSKRASDKKKAGFKKVLIVNPQSDPKSTLQPKVKKVNTTM